MSAADPVEILAEAQGDDALLALATVDLTYPELPGDERAGLRVALQAAAVPHWCDPLILAGVVGTSGAAAAEWLSTLRELPVVEPFPARGAGAANVHEASRLAIRRRLVRVQPQRFQEFSERAAKHFEADERPAGRIEWIFHVLVADPEHGADELDRLDRAFAAGSHEDTAALVVALAELEDQELLTGRARTLARLLIAQRRAETEGAAQIGDLGLELLRDAEAVDDPRLVARVTALVGDVASARGDLTGAEHAHRRALRLYRTLMADGHDGIDLHRDLGATYNRIVLVLLAQGEVVESEQALEHALEITRTLAAAEPGSTVLQRDLAVTYGRIVDAALRWNDLARAEQAVARHLAISEQLVRDDPGNSRWERQLVAAYSRVGEVALRAQDLPAAEQALTRSLQIVRTRAEEDPTNAWWQRELAVSHGRLGDLASRREDLPGAQRAYVRAREVAGRLVERDPDNLSWRRDLALTHHRIGVTALGRGDLAAAAGAFEEELVIARRLAEQDPRNVEWQQDLLRVLAGVGDVALRREDLDAAATAADEALSVARRSARDQAGDPRADDPVALQSVQIAQLHVGFVALRRGDPAAAERSFRGYLRSSHLLAPVRPDGNAARYDIAIGQLWLARAVRAQGRGGAAKAAFGESATILEGLVRGDPDNAGLRRDLAELRHEAAELGEDEPPAGE